MTRAAFLQDQSLGGMLAAAEQETEARALDLTNARREVGWESVVLETPEWIVRFPRHGDADRFQMELAVLEHVRGRLPVKTPEVAWIGSRTHCMAYPKLIGTSFARADWHAATTSDQHRLSQSLADLLMAWTETFDPADIDPLGIGSIGAAPYLSELSSRLRTYPADMRPAIERLLVVFSELYDSQAADPIVLHGDFHLGNMVLDGPCGAVAGLWDFSCVMTGPLTWDLHYLAGELGDAAEERACPGTGRHLDLLSQVIQRCSSVVVSAEAPLLCELMLCVEWLGDHGSAESTRWRDWLASVKTRIRP